MRVLVSVRSVDEAQRVAQAGVGFIDLKEPKAGALGALPLPTLQAVVSRLRSVRPGGAASAPISATIGDLSDAEIGDAAGVSAVLARVRAVRACGVDYVKVGIASTPQAKALLTPLARLDVPLVLVFIADAPWPVAHCLAEAARAAALGFAGCMLDTQDKAQGSLLDRWDDADLRRFLLAARAHGGMAGLAGALRWSDLPRLQQLAPDFAGFRSAVCDGERGGPLSVERLAQLLRALASPSPQPSQPAFIHA